MAAATVDFNRTLTTRPFHVQEIQLSSLTSDQAETLTHNGPSGASAFMVNFVTTTSATSNDIVVGEWIRASDSTSNNTVTVKLKTENGGDLAGAKVSVFIWFKDFASGGIS